MTKSACKKCFMCGCLRKPDNLRQFHKLLMCVNVSQCYTRQRARRKAALKRLHKSPNDQELRDFLVREGLKKSKLRWAKDALAIQAATDKSLSED